MKPILKIWKNFTILKSKKQIFLDSLIFVFLTLAFFTIPTFSSQTFLNYITWGFTAIFVLLVIASFILYYSFKLDTISLFLFLFCFSALISSLLNGMQGFSFTPFLLTFLTILIYSYCKSNKSVVSLLILGIYFSLICFGILFFITYWDALSQLNFDRLGGSFGDENDIAIFFGLGSLISCYFIFYSKNLWNKIISVLILCFFVLLGISTGSKIFIMVIVFIPLALIILFFGKKRWWISLLAIISLFCAIVLVLSLPFAETIKNRLLTFINTFFNSLSSGQNSTDLSSIQRFYMFFDGIEMFFRKPLFGFGINGFEFFGGLNQGWSHNHFSESLADYGLIGSILFNYGIPVGIIGFLKKKESKLIIHYLIILFFIILMFSVALFTQKIYAFVIGISLSELTDDKTFFEFPIFGKHNRRRNEINE